jgi:ubiquinone/menaquinone biosynthesis C-methylase UbiE
VTASTLTEVMLANIQVHTRMVDEYQNEPHFRPENRAKVRKVLESLRASTGGRLLDIGCGTGFIINLARDLFDEIHGVDVTPAMLAKIDTADGKIKLHNVPAEALPLPDGYFDLVSSYAFIHHVENYRHVLEEAYRVLRKGGVLYVDLEPNREFWRVMSRLEGLKSSADNAVFSDLVEKEIHSVLHTDEDVQKQFGIDESTFNKAEYTKAILGGIDASEFTQHCQQIGFSKCEPQFQWFLGQGAIMHGQSFEAAAVIEAYLNRVLPVSEGLFKYVRFLVTK